MIDETSFLILLGKIQSARQEWRDIEARGEYETRDVARRTAEAFDSIATLVQILIPKE